MTSQDSTRHVLDQQIAEYRAKCKGLDYFMVKPALDLLESAAQVCSTDTQAREFFDRRRSDSIDEYLNVKDQAPKGGSLIAKLRHKRELKQALRTMSVAGATDSWFFHITNVHRQAERRAALKGD